MGYSYQLPALNTDFVPNVAGAQQNALRTQQMGMQNQLAAEQVANIPMQRQLDQGALEIQRLSLDIKRKALEQAGTGKEISLDYPAANGQPGYKIKGAAEAIVKVSEMVARFPDQTKDPGFPAWIAKQGVTLELDKQTKAGWSAPKEGIDEQGKPIIYRVNDAGDIDIIKGVQPTPKKGMKIYDPATGNLMVDMGGGEGADLTRKTKGAVEEKILGGKEQLARMQTIVSEFKPEYLETGTRLKAAWTGIKARLGENVSKQDANKLTDFKKFQRKSIENINLYIKELTGAQMSEKEADRLRLAQPDPGENWWNGDDPITYKAKMDDVMKFTRASVARYQFYKSKGLEDSQIKAIINSDTALDLNDMAARMK